MHVVVMGRQMLHFLALSDISPLPREADQCMSPPALFAPPSATRSNGKSRLHTAVTVRIAAEAKTGREGDRVMRNPADTGASIPALGELAVAPYA